MLGELKFEQGIKGPLDRTRELYFETFFHNGKDFKIDQENRERFQRYIGNTAILAFSDNENLFEDFIVWLRKSREIYQNKLKQESK